MTGVMLLIDADNVSVDVIRQGLERLLAQYGEVHVRRAYCTAESALKHQAIFKRLAIRPIVNLAAGKNSTDIALAVDAIDLVLALRPRVVAIASSDSDFAPLVSRLREKGCRVVGIGQHGKTGDETIAVYDEYTVITHRKATTAAVVPLEVHAGEIAPPRRGRRRRSAAEEPAQAGAAAAVDAAPPGADRIEADRSRPPAAAQPEATPAEATPAEATPAEAPAAARTTRGRRRGTRHAAETQTGDASSPASRPGAELPDEVRQVLAALPELLHGETVELRLAAERLRAAELLGPRASSTRFFAPLAASFELLPAGQPNRVRLRG